MPKPFHRLTVEQFTELLERFPFTRQIESLHLHHTWRPNHAQFNGLSTLESIWEHHTRTKGWMDIAQHISIAPDGGIWTGRSWDQAPASVRGFNGNAAVGPFMLTIVGDFDRGQDPFDGEQKQAVLSVIAHLQKQFGLKPETVRFHSAMSENSCPGSALDYETILREVAEVRMQLDSQPAAAEGPINFPFEDRARAVWRIISDLKRAAEQATPGARGSDEGEGCERDALHQAELERTTVAPPETPRTARGGNLPPEIIRSLRPHVINLNMGRFSTTGQFQTRPADVDAIFEEHLHEWARSREGHKLPIVFYAHGGLTSEQAGLLTAHEQVKWWLENGAFPVHFVWETGLLETLGQLLNPNRQRAVDFGAPTDFALETLARGIGGVKIWTGMKVSAERAAEADGGARYTAKKLKEFCDKPEFKDRVELHAVGHSAGSIFHAHFIPAALKENAPPFRSVHFLAPAIRVDVFEQRLLDKIGPGKGVEHLSVFTMARDFELDDNCFAIYRKSLLYLIYYALEPERKTPILGLEESIRENAKLKRLFDLDKKGEGRAEVIWSVSKAQTGLSGTTSRTHGGFNNDAPTMQSVAQRILGREVTPFTGTEERGLSLLETLQAREPTLAPLFTPGSTTFEPVVTQNAIRLSAGPVQSSVSVGVGRKRALCVGIDRYPTAPLAGCANDAREWLRVFPQLGFEEPKLLIDGEATRNKILDELSELLRSSSAGDVLAFQFAGHGTQLRDLNGDEAAGDTPDKDEALCPVDFDRGHFVIDDDLAAVFDKIPPGVNVTIFADCCHSGSNTRLAVGPPMPAAPGRDVRKRFIPATRAMEEAHAAFRSSLGELRAPKGRGAYDRAREILFAACRSREVAFESDGHGHFTTRATRLLASGIQGISNAEFQQRVVHAFGDNSGQNPELHCADALKPLPLLAPINVASGRLESTTSTSGTALPSAWRSEVARILESTAQAIRG